MSRPSNTAKERGPRRTLTDWTTSAGVGGDGLLALVAGDDVTPEAIHLATLGFEVFVLGEGDDLTHVHHVDMQPGDLPELWHGRFSLVVSYDPALVAQLAAVLADGALVAVIGDSDSEIDLSGLTEVARDAGTDPNDPRREFVRVVAAKV